jgi:hypothetical protein
MGNDDSAATRAPTIHDPEGVHLHNCSALYDDLVRAVAVAVHHKFGTYALAAAATPALAALAYARCLSQ